MEDKEKHRYFNQLVSCRYLVTTVHNGNQVTYNNATAGSNWEFVMNTTYVELEAGLKKHFGVGPDAATTDGAHGRIQSFRNHMSTLNSFLAFVGKTIDSRVGVELGSGFDRSIDGYLSALSDLAPRTLRDRRGHLRLIRRLQGVDAKQRSPSRETEFGSVLRTAIARTGLAPKALAISVGISPSAFQRWLKGAAPNKQGIATLRRVEAALELERDSLVRLAGTARESAPSSPTSVAYRERNKARLSSIVRPVAESELTPGFLSEWRRLFDYKTTDFPSLERSPRGRWRLIPQHATRRLGPLVQRGTLVSPAADIALCRVREFLGVLQYEFLCRGIDCAESQTLSWLSVPWALEVFLQDLTTRSEQIRHSGQRTFCFLAAALVRPGCGFLWQQAAFRERLPDAYRPASDDEWRRMCADAYKLLRQFSKECTGVSRDPKDPIASLISRNDILTPVLQAIERIEAAASAAPSGSRSEAILRRDALLLSLLLSNPLRQRTISAMTWRLDGTGTLRGSPSTGYRIQLQPHHLKNGNSQRSRGYDVPVAAWVQARLQAYLEEYRATLLAGRTSPYLFVSGRKNDGLWESISPRVIKLTRRYIDDCPGFGMHAFRHLVATDWLTQHPNDFLTVAELLNDRLETVMENYAHLKRDTSFSRYEQHVCRVIEKARMQ